MRTALRWLGPAALLVLAGCASPVSVPSPAGGPAPPTGDTTFTPPPAGHALSPADLAALAAWFHDQPFQGGQVPPRVSKWVGNDTFVFAQFDRPGANATTLRYLGLGVKGVFCAEAQPDRGNGSFPHFHQWSVADYGQGHGGPPGAQGYWLSWLAVDRFEAQGGRVVEPGIDYAFSPTPPPACGADVPPVNFTASGEGPLTAAELAQLNAWFNEQPFLGGQVPPRVSKWVGNDTFVFAQFDRPGANATALRYLGLGERGMFCASGQPHTDFTHFHRWSVANYNDGHGGAPQSQGYWLLWLAADTFTAQNRTVLPGVDRAFSPTPPPAC